MLLSLAVMMMQKPVVGATTEALHGAAMQGDTAAIQQLLAAGVDIEARDAQGRTALLRATRANQVAAATLLIEAGADVNAKDNIEDSPYLYAGAQGFNDILRLTLAHGADLQSTNRYGGTALIPAAEKGHPETVQLLLDAGVAVDHVNRLGWTALLEAIVLSQGGPVHQRIVQMLIQGGADVNVADGDGVTPLQHAQRRGYTEIVALLQAAGAR
ncbi:ankyrin repeat domain-containing protein [Paenalcaligenes suwonensis]|uniref:ankyrin repeat domain-containing protein n=1 Tax=Paenalcaligenes suwonensis TaxID=1202713 RepID=UPI00140A87A9|nr:ankyrin repeat domain-containing protein [Paenalcaligenes suwonensis]